MNEVRFQNLNVRGASQVRQDTLTDAPDIPDNFTFVQIEEESITLGSDPNGTQAVLVHAFANIDTSGTIDCPCEFRSLIIQDNGAPGQVTSIPAHLEVEGGDGDIDATITHTAAFIATAQTQSYSFRVQAFAQNGTTDDGFYEVDEAGITISTFGLATSGVLKVPN